MTHVAKEDTLYSKALDYVISKQKNASYHKDKEDYHIFTDYIPYGIEKQVIINISLCGYI